MANRRALARLCELQRGTNTSLSSSSLLACSHPYANLLKEKSLHFSHDLTCESDPSEESSPRSANWESSLAASDDLNVGCKPWLDDRAVNHTKNFIFRKIWTAEQHGSCANTFDVPSKSLYSNFNIFRRNSIFHSAVSNGGSAIAFANYASLNRMYSTSSTSASPRVIPSSGGFLLLNEIRDLDGSRKPKMRVGRGIGSGKGKTCGRGHKGQKARSGRKPRIGFEGGQTPLRLKVPKRGFHNPFSLTFQAVNVGDISRKIDEGVIDSSKLITMKTLRDVGLSGKKMKNGVKLLARGAEKLKVPIHIEVSRVSSEAKAAIEGSGGSVTRVHYNRLGLRALLKPGWFTKKHRVFPRPARPPPRLLGRVDAIGRLPEPITPLCLLTPKPNPTETSPLSL